MGSQFVSLGRKPTVIIWFFFRVSPVVCTLTFMLSRALNVNDISFFLFLFCLS